MTEILIIRQILAGLIYKGIYNTTRVKLVDRLVHLYELEGNLKQVKFWKRFY
jgi:hypothetical protein